MEGGDNGGTSKSNGHGLVLYHIIGSSYSQKVLLALYEKKLEFQSYLVNLPKGEHLKPWFMELNPRGEVPVLKDGIRVIYDSHCIVEYLENNFTNDAHPRLFPEKGTDKAQKVKEMQNMLENVKFPILTFGTLVYPELTVDPKITQTERENRIAYFENANVLLDDHSEKYPKFKTQYSEKKNRLQEMSKLFSDVSYVKKMLDDLKVTFDIIEKELGSHANGKETWWLCSENFTVADVLLTLLLHRINHIGVSQRFLVKERPNLQKYYNRVQERDSFKKTFTFANF